MSSTCQQTYQTRRVHTWKEACAAFLVSLLCACHHRLCTTACTMRPGTCQNHETHCIAQLCADDDNGRLCYTNGATLTASSVPGGRCTSGLALQAGWSAQHQLLLLSRNTGDMRNSMCLLSSEATPLSRAGIPQELHHSSWN